MILSDDKHGIVSMIIKKMGTVGPDHENMEEIDKEDGAEQDSDIGHDAAVDEIFEAIESKDKAKFKEALKSFIEICLDECDDDGEYSNEEK